MTRHARLILGVGLLAAFLGASVAAVGSPAATIDLDRLRALAEDPRIALALERFSAGEVASVAARPWQVELLEIADRNRAAHGY